MRNRSSNSESTVLAVPTDADRLTWVRWILPKLAPQLFKLFEDVLRLQSRKISGRGGVDRKTLSMVFHGADKNGNFSRSEEIAYERHPDKNKREHNLNVYLKRLETLLVQIHPPGYPWLIRLKRGRFCSVVGLESSVSEELGTGAGQCVTDWRCLINGREVTTGPIHLPFLPVRKFSPRLRNVGSWKPSKHFPDYPSFQKIRWREFFNENPESYNSKTLYFLDFKKDGNKVEILTKDGEYSNYVATVKSLDKSVTLPNGSRLKVAEILSTDWDRHTNLLPFAVASPVGLDVMVVTKEDTVLACLNRRTQLWDISVSAIPVQAYDKHGKEPDILNNALRRRAASELGLAIEPERIAWMGFGIGQKEGQSDLVGQLKLSKMQGHIKDCFENRPEPEAVEDLAFIPLEIKAAEKFLETKNCSDFFRLGLHLCLWKKFPKQVKIVVN